MPSLLISGPAGAAKSQLARTLFEADPDLHAIADFQAIYVALTLVRRAADGRYPLRDERLLPLVEYLRRRVIDEGIRRELNLIVTNSDGSPERRQFLLNKMGPGAEERVVDPGEDVVRARLADPFDGAMSTECDQAVNRWYRRI